MSFLDWCDSPRMAVWVLTATAALIAALIVVGLT